MLLKVAASIFLDLEKVQIRHGFVQKCRLADQSHQCHVLIFAVSPQYEQLFAATATHTYFVGLTSKGLLAGPRHFTDWASDTVLLDKCEG